MAEVAVAVNKMGKKIIIIGCVIAVVMIVGCQDYGNKHYYHELEKIDHRQNRELARREIMALQKEIASYPDYIKMYHQLLVAELNEEVMPYRNMDVARQLVDYYEQTNDREKLTRSYIIAGHIFANCNDGPRLSPIIIKQRNCWINKRIQKCRIVSIPRWLIFSFAITCQTRQGPMPLVRKTTAGIIKIHSA